MAKKKQNNTATEKPKKRSLLGLIFLPVGLVLGILSYLFLSVLVSTGIEWAGMLFGWWDYRHSELVLRQELHYLGDNFSSTLFGTSAEEAAQRVTRYFQQWLVLPTRHRAEAHLDPRLGSFAGALGLLPQCLCLCIDGDGYPQPDCVVVECPACPGGDACCH